MVFDSGDIFIRTDKPSYVDGETVTGEIWVKSKGSLSYKSLTLRLKGFEETKFSFNVEKRRQEGEEVIVETFPHYRHYKKEFFKKHFTVVDTPGELEKGVHKFAFAFTLPKGLPSSFKHHRGEVYKGEDSIHDDREKHTNHILDGSGGGDYEAKIRYKVKAVLDVVNLFKSDIKETQDIVIYEALDKALEGVSAKAEGKVCFLGCIPKGMIYISSSFDANAYTRGQKANIVAEIDNQSSKAVKDVVTKLMRTVTISSKDGDKLVDVETVSESKFEGVPPGTKVTRNLTLDIPKKALPTTTYAKSVSCKYHVDVEAQVDWAADIELHMPTVILAEVPENTKKAVEVPADLPVIDKRPPGGQPPHPFLL